MDNVLQMIHKLEARLSVIEQHLAHDPSTPLPLAANPYGDPSPEVIQLVQAGNMLKALTAYRAQTGCSLDEAKTALQLA